MTTTWNYNLPGRLQNWTCFVCLLKKCTVIPRRASSDTRLFQKGLRDLVKGVIKSNLNKCFCSWQQIRSDSSLTWPCWLRKSSWHKTSSVHKKIECFVTFAQWGKSRRMQDFNQQLRGNFLQIIYTLLKYHITYKIF